MAFHILFMEAEFPEAFEESPAVGYTLSAKKVPSSSFFKKILKFSTEDIQEKKIQEDIMEFPDYVPIGLKYPTDIKLASILASDRIIPFKEINRCQFNPDSQYRPPRFFHS